MNGLALTLLSGVAAAEPECTVCFRSGSSLAIVIAAVAGGGWVLSEIVGAWRTRRMRAIADAHDTP